MGELGYPRTENPAMRSLMSPNGNGRLSQSNSPHDPRRNLPRRFTTESAGAASTMANPNAMANAPRAPDSSAELSNQQRVLLLEKKKLDYEKLKSQRRQFEMEMAALDQAQRREEEELVQLQKDLGLNSGHQSEPTTPPEYQEPTGFSSFISRPNRYSTSSIVSPTGRFSTGLPNGHNLSPDHVDALTQTRLALDAQLPLRVPQPQDEEDDDDKELAVRQDPTSHRSTNHLNRYSMPVTRSRNGFYDLISLDQANTARFLFGDDENTPTESQFPSSDDNFSTPGRDMDRHSSISSINGTSVAASGDIVTRSRPSSIHHSMELNIQDPIGTAPSGGSVHTPPRLPGSFSTDNMTLGSINTMRANGAASAINNHAQQYLHHHNASMGRIPAGAMVSRHARDLSTDSSMYSQNNREHNYASIGVTLQSSNSNAPYSGGMSQAGSSAATSVPGQVSGLYSSSSAYNNVAPSQSITGMMNSLSLTTPSASQTGTNNSNNYSVYPQAGAAARDSQQRLLQSRRPQETNDNARFNNKTVHDFIGRIYDISKDQFGCRFLQRELEQKRPNEVHAIWLETHLHVVELMIDPFGNYLCQKLLEFCNDDDRTRLIEEASHDMVRIALNQHGTRALQKMIEYVSTPEQVAIITKALHKHVVSLIQDLNGNHVIQRCLTKLSSDDAAFIFDAVGNFCVVVGTHRHGCCVIQRCIDHAVGEKKAWLINCIIVNSMTLVGDAYGNYVIQYILELNDPVVSERMAEQFIDNFIELSKQKFSSNAMEKCLRHAPSHLRDNMVSQMLAPGEIDRMLKDPFANYVVQAALEHSTPHMKETVVSSVRPLLNVIRHMPYGRRVQARISQYDATRAQPSSEVLHVASMPGSNGGAMTTTANTSSAGQTIIMGADRVGYTLVPLSQAPPTSRFSDAAAVSYGNAVMPSASMAHTLAMQQSLPSGSMVHHYQAMMTNNQAMMGNNQTMMGNNQSMMGNNQSMMGNGQTIMANGQYHHQIHHQSLQNSLGHNAIGSHHGMPPLSASVSRTPHHPQGYGYNPMGHDDSNWL